MSDTPYYQKEVLDLKPESSEKPKDFKAPKVELSENITRFDDRVKKVHTKNPYDYNTVSLNKDQRAVTTPTASAMITNPEYNTVGKFLGVDTLHEWNKDYDKVYEIVKWAKAKSGAEDTTQLVQWLNGALQFVPSLSTNHKKIDQLFLYSKMQASNIQTQPKVVTRTVVKKVIKKVYVKPKETTEQFVNKFMEGAWRQ